MQIKAKKTNEIGKGICGLFVIRKTFSVKIIEKFFKSKKMGKGAKDAKRNKNKEEGFSFI